MIAKFERKKIDPNTMYGEIVNESNELILIHYSYDLLFDGYRVIRRRDVTDSFSDESDRYHESLMKKEGLWKRPEKFVKQLDLTSWQTLLAGLVGKMVILENERTGDFLIGPLLECRKSSAVVYYFDEFGNWLEPRSIQYRRITILHLNDRYSTIHAKYLKKRPSESNE